MATHAAPTEVVGHSDGKNGARCWVHCVIAHSRVAAPPPAAPFDAHRCVAKTYLHIIHVYLQSLLSSAKQFLMRIPSVVNHTFVWAKAISSVCFIPASLLSLLLLSQQTKACFFSDRKCASLTTCGEQRSLFFPQTHRLGKMGIPQHSLPSWEFPLGQNSSEPTPCPSYSGSCPVSLANLKPMILDHRYITKEVRAFVVVVVVVAAAALSLSGFSSSQSWGWSPGLKHLAELHLGPVM